jgi:ABC-type polysaccharide/polyol phosphate export permease
VRRHDSKGSNLLWELTHLQLELKDQSTFFGVPWCYLNPLFMVGVLFVFFHAQVGSMVERDGISLLLGLVQYTYCGDAANTSMRVPRTMRQLTQAALFPFES